MSRFRVVKASVDPARTLGEPDVLANSRSEPALAVPRGPRRLPRQPRSRALVDAILEASTRVFLRRGYAGATTNEVAEVAGVSIGSLYQYFPDKTALLTALHEQHLSLMSERLSDVLHGTRPSPPAITSTLAAVARHCLELHHDNLELQCLLHQHYPQLAPSPFASKAKVQLNQAVMDWLRRNFSDVEEARLALVSGTLLRLTENLVHATVLSPCSSLPMSTMETNVATALRVYLEAQGLKEKRA